MQEAARSGQNNLAAPPRKHIMVLYVEFMEVGMASIEELREYAWGVNRFLVGAEGKHGAKQAIESGKDANDKLPGLTEDLKAKLAAASTAASALLSAAEITAASFIQGKEDVGRAKELGGYFDSENAVGLRTALAAGEAATGARAAEKARSSF